MCVDTNAISKKPPLLIAQETQHKLGVAFSYLERKKAWKTYRDVIKMLLSLFQTPTFPDGWVFRYYISNMLMFVGGHS